MARFRIYSVMDRQANRRRWYVVDRYKVRVSGRFPTWEQAAEFAKWIHKVYPSLTDRAAFRITREG